MNKQITKSIKSIAVYCVNVMRKSAKGRAVLDLMTSRIIENYTDVDHNAIKLRLAAPNYLCEWRNKTFSTKEPETLEWIDKIPEGSNLWDIGANVGLYSVYAARKRKCKVWAFEPSVFNLELLARNIFLNDVTQDVCIIPLPLSNQAGPSHMRITTMEWGGSLSTFGPNIGYDGNEMNQVFDFQTFGLTMDDVKIKFLIPTPDYIKMDVDGIEHLILQGGTNILKEIKGILIEVKDDFHEQANQCSATLLQAGLLLKEKISADDSDLAKFSKQQIFNQIWVREDA